MKRGWLVALWLCGCVPMAWVRAPLPSPPLVATEGEASSPEEWAPFPSAPGPSFAGSLVARRAGALVGTRLSQVSREVPDDCSGLARLAYAAVGLNLTQAAQPGDNAVTAMYRLAELRGALSPGDPEPGDLIFFKETYDRNRNGRFDDGLTHVAVVESVDLQGTVTYVHRSGSGVTRGKLTVAQPQASFAADGSRLNDYLRPRSRLSEAVLSGTLFVAYGHLSRLLP